MRVSETLQNNWQLISGATNAKSGEQFLCNTTAGTFTLSLPTSPAPVLNDTVSFADYAGTFATNKLVVAPGAYNIMGINESMDCQINNLSVTLVYSGNATYGWRVV